MDIGDPHTGEENGLDEIGEERPRPRRLPDDLPKSLDDRRTADTFGTETEIYDAWQGVLMVELYQDIFPIDYVQDNHNSSQLLSPLVLYPSTLP
jgi:hypothetical protein